MDKGGSRLGTWVVDIFPDAKGHTGLEHPARRQIAWALQQYRELGYELDKNYHYERILSTSIRSSGSSGI
jgi:hypothetical protein